MVREGQLAKRTDERFQARAVSEACRDAAQERMDDALTVPMGTVDGASGNRAHRPKPQ